MRLALLFLIACGGTPKTVPDTPPSAMSNNDAVLLTVFLHELAAASITPDTGVCLAIRGEVDDFASVLAGVQAKYPKAVANSECSGGGPSGPVVLNAGGSAVRLDIGPISWPDANTAKITGGGAHAGGPTADEREYTVVKDGSGWKVTDEKPGLTI